MNKCFKSTAILTGIAATLLSASVAAKSVTIGYMSVFDPWKQAISEKLIKKDTGYDVKWRRFDSGAKVITAMASGSVDMASLGSSPIAAAVSRGVNMEVVWVLENIADAEALVVRNGTGINSPSDLKGKRIAVPFVSTTHYHTLFALQQFGLTEKDVKLINMQPNNIVAGWIRGDIDGAFIWNPALGKIKADGKVLITSKTLSSWGRATFNGLVVNKEFSKDNADFVTKVVKIASDQTALYHKEKATLTTDSPMIKNIVKVAGGDINTVVDVLALYDFPEIKTQLSCTWLGCGMKSGVAKALKETSKYLKKKRKFMSYNQIIVFL